MSRPDTSAHDGCNLVEQQATAWFVRMRADDASERDRQAWQQWLHADPVHRTAYGRIEALWSSLGEFATAPEHKSRLLRKRHRKVFTSRSMISPRSICVLRASP
ncbi:MAG: FecR/PupR family sigma factor regulator, partial [Stenotrophomonas sp.]|nr:FecR/PupR family sigma factor regulator [Stenotrophomonas sp.]